MKIIADTPALFSPEEGRKMGLSVIPACTLMGEDAYRDYEDITTEEFLKKVSAGAGATTSQPSIGEIIEVYQETDEEMLVLPIGDGLSGTYQNMESARNMVDCSERIHVVDTQTLAGPQHYLVKKAMQLRDAGHSIQKIKQELKASIESSASFVIPVDFHFLKRSGRLTPMAAKLGTMLKIVPVLTQTKDRKKITVFAIKRTKDKAVAAIIEYFKSIGVDRNFLITVSHGGVWEEAKAVAAQLKEHFRETAVEIFPLIPSLVCHGGPGCLVIQTVRM